MRVQMLAVLLLFVSLFCAEGIHGMSLAGTPLHCQSWGQSPAVHSGRVLETGIRFPMIPPEPRLLVKETRGAQVTPCSPALSGLGVPALGGRTRRVQGDGEERSGSEFRWLSLLLFLLSWVARLWDLLRLLTPFVRHPVGTMRLPSPAWVQIEGSLGLNLSGFGGTLTLLLSPNEVSA
ncbi:unnamed protein product [Lepidochelys kempii]